MKLCNRKWENQTLVQSWFWVVFVSKKTGTEIATALNNMDVSSEYVLKLKHEIEEQCAEVSHNS